jgi:hypothetical protein
LKSPTKIVVLMLLIHAIIAFIQSKSAISLLISTALALILVIMDRVSRGREVNP